VKENGCVVLVNGIRDYGQQQLTSVKDFYIRRKYCHNYYDHSIPHRVLILANFWHCCLISSTER